MYEAGAPGEDGGDDELLDPEELSLPWNKRSMSAANEGFVGKTLAYEFFTIPEKSKDKKMITKFNIM